MALVLVTGANRGVGLKVASRAAAAGHSVVGTMRDPGLREALDREAARPVDVRRLDVGDQSSIDELVDALAADGVEPEVLINNAGLQVLGPAEFADRDDAESSFSVNVIGPMMLAKALLPSMRASRSGQIISVSSLVQRAPLTSGLASIYAASKAALHTWAYAINKELLGFEITSHVVELGGFATDMMSADRYRIEALAPGESNPYRAVAEVAGDVASAALARMAPADVAADAIVGLIGDPAAPLHLIVPAAMERFAAASDGVSDQDYRRLCAAATGQEFQAALQVALTNATS